MKASVGRIVHFIHADVDGPRAAIVTHVYERDDDPNSRDGVVDVTVFGMRARFAALGVPHESMIAPQAVYFWRWPPRVD